MKKKREGPLTAKETLEAINKQWATREDIVIIGFVGYTKAGYIFNEIETNLSKQGYRLPANRIPMESVVDYFKINVNYLKKVSK